MKEKPLSHPGELATIPAQVWKTLTPAQQQAIFRAIVRICQSLSTQGRQEGNNEPDPSQ